MLHAYQKKLIDLYTLHESNKDKSLSGGDRNKSRADHLKTCIEVELEEAINVVSRSIDGALGIDYAKKNPQLVADLVPMILNDVRQYVQDFASQFNEKPKTEIKK